MAAAGASSVRVTLASGEVVDLRSVRVSRMVAYLVAEERRIGSAHAGALTFSFVGASSLVAELSERADLGDRGANSGGADEG